MIGSAFQVFSECTTIWESLAMEDQKDLFISFCNSRYGTSAEGDQSAACGRSKTITKAKGQKIINVLKSNQVALEYSRVKQKGFKLMSHQCIGSEGSSMFASKEEGLLCVQLYDINTISP